MAITKVAAFIDHLALNQKIDIICDTDRNEQCVHSFLFKDLQIHILTVFMKKLLKKINNSLFEAE